MSNSAPFRLRGRLIPSRIVWGTLVIVLLILLAVVLGNDALQLFTGVREGRAWDWLSLALSILAAALVIWLLIQSFTRRQSDWLVPTRFVWGMLIIVLILLGLVLGYTVLEPYTGFSERRAWDWLKLGGVSLAIALVGWLFTREQRAREEQVTLEQTQDAALAAYLDQMSNLMIDHRLGLQTNEDKDGDLQPSVRKVAQARTLAILLVMDAEHKRRPLKLVYELGLITNGEKNTLELKNAALDHANLSELSLRCANLRGADLRAANLTGVDLSGSDLSEADLRGANLKGANLSGVNLTRSNLLPYDERHPERWSQHHLEKTIDLDEEDLRRRKHLTITKITNLREAILIGAQLSDAWLGDVDLKDANLSEADLEGTSLHDATLTNADLTGVDFARAKGTSEEEIKQQTDKVERTTMPESKPRSQLLNETWEAYEKSRDYPTAVALAQEYIDRSSHQAVQAQKKLEHNHAQEPPTGSVDEETKERILAREFLNGAATCYWIKGQALEASDQADDARRAYKEAHKFTYARAWDKDKKVLWSPAQSAGDRLAELES